VPNDHAGKAQRPAKADDQGEDGQGWPDQAPVEGDEQARHSQQGEQAGDGHVALRHRHLIGLQHRPPRDPHLDVRVGLPQRSHIRPNPLDRLFEAVEIPGLRFGIGEHEQQVFVRRPQKAVVGKRFGILGEPLFPG